MALALAGRAELLLQVLTPVLTGASGAGSAAGAGASTTSASGSTTSAPLRELGFRLDDLDVRFDDLGFGLDDLGVLHDFGHGGLGFHLGLGHVFRRCRLRPVGHGRLGR